MIVQKYFNYHFSEMKDKNNFFVNSTNQDAFNAITNDLFDQNILLIGPPKSGKSHLINIWKEKNDALMYNNNFSDIIKSVWNAYIIKFQGVLFNDASHFCIEFYRS